jgi:hypothetical protein
MKDIKIGSTWWAGGDYRFVVTKISDNEKNTWIHYKDLTSDKEYSCYLESFLSRFTEIL